MPGAPFATTLVTLDLLPESVSYCDYSGDGMPILVVDFGYTEIQIAVPGAVATVEDLALLDRLVDAILELRKQLICFLD